jgi:hypothetical protein
MTYEEGNAMETKTMAELSDYDRMELIAFDRKVEFDGFRYAFEEYAPEFQDEGMRVLAESKGAFRAWFRAQAAGIDAWWSEHFEDGVDLHNAHIEAQRGSGEVSAR